ncbi:BREX-1 system adenine-specific DNA-methyltransferase PglX [Rheinheimera sp. D18]|uniref:BREX-1 system adenine-specific DNA-methyltransferase PglX n=1 Tax=Rheinheimera sp. D18 TaxID=2545632 RepID=UPI00104CC244|nr:BREX-1 system adenine-specific DNA-methyltransferase PglX [Rheinheimera sp. D18]QBL08841.1 BREX-1 system adenine-specific DNA-methyltransferase PglX [Rheinheimera sp. D18]
MAFDQSTRNRLQKFVSSARAILSEEFTRQLQATYGLDPKLGTNAPIKSLTHLDNRQRQTAHLLRETLAHYLATTPGKTEKDRIKQVLDRIVREQAFTVLNRLAALRMAEARGFLLESIAKGHNSQGFKLYRFASATAHGETGDAYRNYLFSLFDEFSLDLAVLFDRHSAQGRLFPRESALLELLGEINHVDIEHLWAEDETIGWIYQYFNSQEERKKMRAESQAPRNSRELAVRNQFFTPRYVVEFLTDNTLGRIWYEMTQGNTGLVDSCRYLVRRPTEIFLKPGEDAPETEQNDEALSQQELLQQPVYIPHRPLKDPRTIRMLDPACGSMHFGLYAFDLFERIYLEAWQLEQQLGAAAFTREDGLTSLQETYASLDAFKQQIPKLIIEHNIHGVDIDPRAVQIAGLSLWQRAQRAWHQQGLKPQQRPTIVKSNIVCAEPMPGEKALLQEFTSKLNPPVLGQLLEVIFDKMQLAGEAGTLLKIEEEIQTAIQEARKQWLKQSGGRGTSDLFQAELDAAIPQTTLGFDLRGINDESFWDDAESRILQALSDYAEQAEATADQKRLFAEDAAKGFAFIDLCRKRFDVFLMNPPFGSATKAVDEYIKRTYLDYGHDIINNFLERAESIGTRKRFCGVILSRTLILNERITNFRKQFLLKKNSLSFLVDLGNGVLDAAVDTAALIFKERNIQERTICGDILRISADEKAEAVLKFSNLDYDKTYVVKSQDFLKVPMGVLCYWVKPWMLELFKKDRLDPEIGVVKKGLITGNDDRFARNHWEVIDYEWSPLFKGGEFSTFYSPLDMKINWRDNGRELRAFAVGKYGSESRTLKNVDYIGRSSVGWGIKNSVGFGVRLIEKENVVYNDNGPAFFIHEKMLGEYSIYSILSIFNSSLFKVLLRIFQVGERGRYQWLSAHVSIMPKPISFDHRLSEIGKNLTAFFRELYSWFEESDDFDINEFKSLVDKAGQIPSYIDKNIQKLELLYIELDEIVLKCFEVDISDFNEANVLILDERERPEKNYRRIVDQLLSSLDVRIVSVEFGRLFGRWGGGISRVLSTDKFDVLYDALDIGLINNSFKDRDNLIAFLHKPSGFFDMHLGMYSANKRQAPIYWPIQTPSISYTLWLYYHQIDEQTLYTCVNDFVEPKLAQVEHDLSSLRSKSARSSQEEKELEKLSDLVSELRDFRDELLRIAKFWKPNLNDGVQITAAPLWKLFQHKAWQKKLKETWESLEQGEYDWAHLACSIWPDRVLRKCHQDRSLAIAHDVEGHFWHEVEVPVTRGKKATGETKFEWQPKDLTEPEILNLIKRIKEEKGL